MECKPARRPVSVALASRRVLSLDERVAVIKSYDSVRVYSKIAKQFGCSWEQVKNIITKRETIMTEYKEAQKLKKNSPQSVDGYNKLRQQKIKLLSECLFEYLKRHQCHYREIEITADFKRQKATELRDLLEIVQFTPSYAWMEHFDSIYSKYQPDSDIMPPMSLDLTDIIEYCKENKCSIAFGPYNENITPCPLKMYCLEKSLLEYIQRYQYNCKTYLNDEALLSITFELRDILNIDDFFPNKTWFKCYRSRYDTQVKIENEESTCVVADSDCLDLHEILYYCAVNDIKFREIFTSMCQPTLRSFDENILRNIENSVSKDEDGAIAKKPKLDTKQGKADAVQ